MYTLSTSPKAITGEVTAVKETYFYFNEVMVYFKTLNGNDSGLGICYYGTLKDIEIGSQYKISVSWFNQLQSIEKIK